MLSSLLGEKRRNITVQTNENLAA